MDAWKELKRDIPDHMVSRYAMDRKIYKIKGANQDVDWRFCVEYPKNIRFKTIPHVNPYSRIPKLITTRETRNCYVSKKFGNHKKDWDFIVKYRDRISNRQKIYIPRNISIFKKLNIIVNDIAIVHEVKSGEFLHMADTIDKGGWCTGQAAAITAIAHTMGLEARTILIAKKDGGGHTNGEIKIYGKWRFCENIDYCRGDICIHLMDKSWIEVWADPDACKELPPQQKNYYRNVFDFLYVMGTQWHVSTIGSYSYIRFTPESAKALYPEMDTFRIKYLYHSKPDKLWLLTGSSWDDGIGWDTLRYRKIEQGQGIRKCFYISSLKGVKKISSHITLVKNNSIDSKSSNWYIRLNDEKKYYLKDLRCWWKYSGDVLFHGGEWWKNEKKIPKAVRRHLDLGWRWHGGKKKENQLCFLLPLEALKENTLNKIELMSDTRGKEHFNVRLVDNPILPAPKPFFYR